MKLNKIKKIVSVSLEIFNVIILIRLHFRFDSFLFSRWECENITVLVNTYDRGNDRWFQETSCATWIWKHSWISSYDLYATDTICFLSDLRITTPTISLKFIVASANFTVHKIASSCLWCYVLFLIWNYYFLSTNQRLILIIENITWIIESNDIYSIYC